LSGYKISVVIPVKNGADTLDSCVRSLRQQTIGAQLEIIIVDSMSTDSSREIAEKHGAKIIDVPIGEFDHGLTRNKGVQATSGELVFLTVQDARMGSIDLIERMASHFIDPELMAVVGHQAVPHEKDTNPLQWYRPVSLPGITQKRIDDITVFEALPPKQQQDLIAWDDVVAMYRKTALIEQPFVQTAFAEDWIWSNQALRKGWLLLHDSSLIVYHYHHQGYRYVFNTTYTVNYHFFQFFGHSPSLPPVLMPALRAMYHLGKHDQLSIKEKSYWILHNISALLAKQSSTRNFLDRLKRAGKKGIEQGYALYCNVIPQGKQKE
jgi:rhamnosyltransferase